MMLLAAVVFDLDGVLIDSEGVWDVARREVTRRAGGRWRPDAQRTMMGMSSTEWSTYMHEVLGVKLSPAQISEAVVELLRGAYAEDVPLMPGAREAVLRLGAAWPLALASSANRSVIEFVLDRASLASQFAAVVSSEEVREGKPAPDVYLEAARRLGVEPACCAAVEDSGSGLRSAVAAGMRTIAIPNREFPPDGSALSLAADEIGSLAMLTTERIKRLF